MKLEMKNARAAQTVLGLAAVLVAQLVTVTSQAQAPAAPAPAPIKPPTVTAPTITNPTVTNPTVQKAQAPTGAASGQPAPPPAAAGAPAQAGGRAALVVTAYDEATFKTASATGQPIVLLFAAAGDPVWAAQAAALQTVLRDPEFLQKVPAYQVDMTSAEIVNAYNVKAAGTILVMKDGVERLRSTRMTKPDVIKKMLRLRSAL